MTDIFRYKNRFMYFILGRDGAVDRSWLYCSGVSMSQFLPITRGRHGLASNPAMRGLQIADMNLSRDLRDNGAQIATVKGNPCDPLVPKGGDWYRQMLLISNADEQIVKELVGRGPLELIGSVFKACMISDAVPPEAAQQPDKFEALLAGICEKYSTQAGWPTTASAKGFRK
ncbi:MAG TPA: hypothetical protein VMB78_09585 [Dissulfurispiraceae bacterium]|nr:hypothetical protein [Dissulfurispiraceae bacterium]